MREQLPGLGQPMRAMLGQSPHFFIILHQGGRFHDRWSVKGLEFTSFLLSGWVCDSLLPQLRATPAVVPIGVAVKREVSNFSFPV